MNKKNNLKTKKYLGLLAHPSMLPNAIIAKYGKALSGLFKDKAFYMQGRMDMDPRSTWHKKEFAEMTGGYFPQGDGASRALSELESWDIVRQNMLTLFLRTIVANRIEGEFAELGVYRGNTARLMHKYAPERKLHLFDTFEGFSERGASAEKRQTGDAVSESQFSNTSVEGVKEFIDPNANVTIYKGYFPDSAPSELAKRRFSFVHLDADLYEPTLAGLDYFYPKMNAGGFIIVHDYNAWSGARRATDAFFKDKKEKPVPMPDKSGSALIIKQ